MTARRADIAAVLPPRLLSREQAAAYVGLSPNAFDAEVQAGTFPGAFRLRTVRRALWDVRALDAALDRASAIAVSEDDWEQRKAAWEAGRQDRPQAARRRQRQGVSLSPRPGAEPA